ncbi:adenosine deaminase [Gemmatimonas groenlandica]|uniref:adenosine deaminase n=1 Tax=Gemmatimonas groenlandica TaxID=2732249 RepID=A0A6M4IQE2_9BACT|nr:adenosine deaminase [Gemmatimonas groenlandica]QJR34491.1 adenosine deaminase [Gemmatimonas groenlandica]
MSTVNPAFIEIVQRMPKADLHCHLDGSLRPSTLLELSTERGLALPVHTASALGAWMLVDDARNLEDYLARFEVTLAVMQDIVALERIAHEFVLDAALDGVRYIEARFCPALNVRGGLSLDDVMQAVLRGLARGEKESGTLARVIVCALRSFPWPHALEMAELAVAYKGRGVVAFDLAGGESGNPASDHALAFDYARQHDLAVTVHAGEGDGPTSIREALHRCGADRIGHGTRLREDPSLEAYVIDHRITLEVCPTSNVQTRVVSTFGEHPLARYVVMGAVVTINTDNRLMSGVSLTDEYVRCAQHLNFDIDTLAMLAITSFDSSFLPHVEREALRESIAIEVGNILADADDVTVML